MEQLENLKSLQNITHGFYNRFDSKEVKNPILMRQNHTDEVLVIQEALSEIPTADALVTNVRGLNLTVRTADCAPVLMADSEAGVIAAVHAGWRGALNGVIEKAVQKMIELGAHPDKIVAGFGPCLKRKSFDVQADFISLLPEGDQMMFIDKSEERTRFDFETYIIARLAMADVMEQVDFSEVDTFTDSNYASHRREPKSADRNYSCIMLK